MMGRQRPAASSLFRQGANVSIHARSIRYFDAIRRAGSIREAARQLHVDSSAVNRQLLNLEEEIGTPLFERLPSGLRLTEAGRIFARHVLTVLQDEQRAKAEIERLMGIEGGEVKLGAVEGLSLDFLPLVLDRVMQRHPGITIHTCTMGSADIADQVRAGDVDIGIGFGLPAHPELSSVGQGEFTLGAIVAAGHPLAGRRSVSFAQCAAYPLILASEDLALHALVAPLLEKHGAQARLIAQTNSIELMRQLAMRGHGVAFQTSIGLAKMRATGRLAYLPLKAPVIRVRLQACIRSARSLPPAVDAVVAILREELSRLQGEQF